VIRERRTAILPALIALDWNQSPGNLFIDKLEPRHRRRSTSIWSRDTARIKKTNTAALFIPRNMGVSMQNNINIFGRSFRRNVLKSQSFATANKIERQRPLKIAVAIPAYNRDSRRNGMQRIQNRFRTDIPQMPDFVRARGKLDNSFRQFVMRIRENKDACHSERSRGTPLHDRKAGFTGSLDCASLRSG